MKSSRSYGLNRVECLTHERKYTNEATLITAAALSLAALNSGGYGACRLSR
jgi:hypothetical protein